MNAFELLEKCEQSGVKVKLIDPEHITFEPIERLPEGFIDLLIEHKPDIITYLLSQQRNTAPLVANDAEHGANLTQRQQRALNGYFYVLNKKRQNLIEKGCSDHSAMVSVAEWRSEVQLILCIDRFQMQKIEKVLIEKGCLAYSTKNWLIEGNGKIRASQISGSNPECLHDGTAKGFYAWLDGNDTIH